MRWGPFKLGRIMRKQSSSMRVREETWKYIMTWVWRWKFRASLSRWQHTNEISTLGNKVSNIGTVRYLTVGKAIRCWSLVVHISILNRPGNWEAGRARVSRKIPLGRRWRRSKSVHEHVFKITALFTQQIHPPPGQNCRSVIGELLRLLWHLQPQNYIPCFQLT